MVRFMNDNPRHRKPTVMKSHHFSVGALVAFRAPSAGERINFRVTRQLPDGGQGFQYRIRSERDGQERVAIEANLERQ
jgi:hypothetical protein